MKKLALLATGGTIASLPTANGFVPALTGRELLALAPALKNVADIEVQQIMNIDSSEMQAADWRTLARAVHRLSQRVDGVIISHGTDTMCYTAAALSFMLSDLSVPVVLTGAQVPISQPGSDAPGNLLDAAIVARDGEAGVQIVFNHKIIHGARAFKMYSQNRDAYVSRNYPLLGQVRDGTLERFHHARIKHGGQSLFTGLDENVFLLKLTPVTSPSLLDHIAADDYSGVVLEGFGTGGIANLNRGMAASLERLTRELKIPAVMISQCPYDGVHLAVYGIGKEAEQAGVISGNDMTTECALVKLMWALGNTRDPIEIKKLMETNLCDEISLEQETSAKPGAE